MRKEMIKIQKYQTSRETYIFRYINLSGYKCVCEFVYDGMYDMYDTCMYVYVCWTHFTLFFLQTSVEQQQRMLNDYTIRVRDMKIG